MADEDNAPTPGSRWSYKGRSYDVVANGDTTRVKDDSDGSWSRGVRYEQVPLTGEPRLAYTFSRKEVDFLNKFIREG